LNGDDAWKGYIYIPILAKVVKEIEGNRWRTEVVTLEKESFAANH